MRKTIAHPQGFKDDDEDINIAVNIRNKPYRDNLLNFKKPERHWNLKRSEFSYIFRRVDSNSLVDENLENFSRHNQPPI